MNPELCPLAWWVGVPAETKVDQIIHDPLGCSFSHKDLPAGEAPGLMRVPPGILLERGKFQSDSQISPLEMICFNHRAKFPH